MFWKRWSGSQAGERPAAVRVRGGALLNALAGAYVLGVHLQTAAQHTQHSGASEGVALAVTSVVWRMHAACAAANAMQLPRIKVYNDFKWRVTPSAVFGFTQSHHRGCWWLARALRERMCVCMHIEAELCARVCLSPLNGVVLLTLSQKARISSRIFWPPPGSSSVGSWTRHASCVRSVACSIVRCGEWAFGVRRTRKKVSG